ncbi:unnamed protein product [Toxocara canis]|uniref:Neurofilament heavy polypeptide-like n=1 Tax=Toxocara canis TaxID=6265 RepID=A0A183UD24_TOXCA|nr:unnamed protein product [Toxocara canis]
MEKIVQPKQQQPLKKEKPKKVAPEVSEQPQRVESDKRKGAAKEPKSEEKETKAAAEVSEAEKKEPKVTARESEPSSKELKQDTKKVKESIPESVSTKSNKKKSKKAVEHSVIDQQKVVEEVQPKKEESTAPASSPTSERQHTDDYFRENGNLHEERKGAEEARVPEPVDTAYRSNENVLEETMENGVVGVKDFIAHNSADADAAIESAEKAALREEPDAAVKDVHLPPNDADVAFAPVHASKQEKPSLIENHIEKVEQTENQGAPYAEQPCADAQHAPLMADTDHALLDEKHEEKSYQESKNHEEHDTKGKKQRRHKGRHSDSEKHGEEEQSEEGESVEMNEAEQAAGGDFTEVISRRHKKKGRPSESESAHEDSSATAELAKEPHKNGEEKHGAKSESVEVVSAPLPVSLSPQ